MEHLLRLQFFHFPYPPFYLNPVKHTAGVWSSFIDELRVETQLQRQTQRLKLFRQFQLIPRNNVLQLSFFLHFFSFCSSKEIFFQSQAQIHPLFPWRYSFFFPISFYLLHSCWMFSWFVCFLVWEWQETSQNFGILES